MGFHVFGQRIENLVGKVGNRPVTKGKLQNQKRNRGIYSCFQTVFTYSNALEEEGLEKHVDRSSSGNWKGQNKTLISFPQEKLLNSNQRAEMKAYWNKKMDKITEKIKNKPLTIRKHEV